MKITVIGTGVLGLATATSLAGIGHDVLCLDRDENRVERLSRGLLPFEVPEYNELLADATECRRLRFTSRFGDTIASAEAVILAVDTLIHPDDSEDLRELWIATDLLVHDLRPDTLLVIKSAVPAGTDQRMADRIDRMIWRAVDVVSEPFSPSAANWLDDVFMPHEIILGCRKQETADRLRQMYAAMPARVVVVTPESSLCSLTA